MAKPKRKKTIIKRKPINEFCVFCKEDRLPSYLEIEDIGKFVSDRARIVNRERSGLCSKHNRALAQAVKRARHIGLLPFQGSV